LIVWKSKSKSGRSSSAHHLVGGEDIEQFADPLVLLPVLHAGGRGNDDDEPFRVSVRQFEQQILPGNYPASTVWGYGDPSRPDTFFHPSFSVENIQHERTDVKWINELVKDPDACRESRNHEDRDACAPLKHVVQDVYGVSIVDRTLHWANPAADDCADGTSRTNCRGRGAEEYDGPIPMVVHVHGSIEDPVSDGYPEAWYLPNYKLDNDPYTRRGTTYGSLDGSTGEDGYALYSFTNSYESSTRALWFHDHSLGITRLNMYAAAGGFWFIRRSDGTESGLERGRLPGPPPRKGDSLRDLNTEGNPVREGIREIPLVITPKSFYKDGRLFYPANRAYFEGLGDGTAFGDNGDLQTCDGEGSFPPAWNPEVFFDVMVVNGKSWPYLGVRRERYRFRILNGADSRVFNLAFMYYCRGVDLDREPDGQLPMYVVGTEQGLRPNGPGRITMDQDGAALLLSPGERGDIIVDFNELPNAHACPSAEVVMINTGPDEPFGGDLDLAWRDRPMGRVMKFVVSDHDGLDSSSEIENLEFDSNPGGTKLVPDCGSDCVERHFALTEETISLSATGSSKECYEAPLAAKLGWYGPNSDFSGGAIPLLWSDEIVTRPEVGVAEEWHIWNESADAHPIHVHRANVQLISRHAFAEGKPGTVIGPGNPISESEIGWKDMVVSYPGQVTKIRVKFLLPGLAVWHCHVLSHEDNEMMLPFLIK